MPRRTLLLVAACGLLIGTLSPSASAQSTTETAVRALADSALVRITDEDWEGLTDLYLDEAVSFIAADKDGTPVYAVRTRSEQRASNFDGDIVERGFDPVVQVSGNLAVVWYPYDLNEDGEWSHCGVDVFQFVRTPDGWRIATASWTVEQPPACERHPDGPPSG